MELLVEVRRLDRGIPEATANTVRCGGGFEHHPDRSARHRRRPRRENLGPVRCRQPVPVRLRIRLVCDVAPIEVSFGDALGIALFVVGTLDSVVDVAQNARGLRVQRLYRRSIVNSMHGARSIGAVLGGLMGSTAAGPRLSPSRST
nr:hypothetical protein [Micromonospora sp. AMSO31t]